MTLFFYVLREYVKYVIGTIVLTIFLFILFDFIHRTTKYFAEYDPPAEHILQFYLLQIPAQVVQAMPIASLLASVVCMILLSRTNEITAMRAAGMGAFRIGAPLAFGGLCLSLSSLFLGELVVPKLAEKMHYVQEVIIEGESDTEILEGARWLRHGENLFNFGDYDPIAQVMLRVKFIEVSDSFRPTQLVQASHAKYLPETDRWLLSNIRRTDFERNGTVGRVQYEAEREVEIPLEPTKLKKERRRPGELSIGELRDYVKRGDKSGADTVGYKVDYHAKMAYPFAAFVVSLIGLKFGYRSERTTETAKGVVLAFAIGISYWFIHNASTALGRVGDVPPVVAAWTANVVIFGITLLDAWQARRSS